MAIKNVGELDLSRLIQEIIKIKLLNVRFYRKVCQFRNSLDTHVKVVSISFYADTHISLCFCRGNCSTGAHKWVKHNPLAEGERSTYDLSHKGLRLQARVMSNCTLST